MHDLSYQCHGGSGFTHAYLDILEMDYVDADRWVEMLNETRDKEAKAMKRAASGPPG